MTGKEALNNAIDFLSTASIPSARLDGELLLAYVLDKPREYIIAHDDETIGNDDLVRLNKLLTRRVNREPLAYLIRQREFYGRSFYVDKNVLIPRPESEVIIDEIKRIASVNNDPTGSSQANHLPLRKGGMDIIKLADIGTGSGCLAITAKLELPQLNVYASDVSSEALRIAKKNAAVLLTPLKERVSGGAVKTTEGITLLQSNLFDSYSPDLKFDIIVANLPYVDKSWPELSDYPELNSEPNLALYADDNGLELIKGLITSVSYRLKPAGYLILELDPRQTDAIIAYAKQYGFTVDNQQPFTLTLRRH